MVCVMGCLSLAMLYMYLSRDNLVGGFVVSKRNANYMLP